LAAKASTQLSSKVTTVISSSYADTEFRESLALLDERGTLNTAETRRQLRLDLQKEVIDSNGEIIDEFAKVAEVWHIAPIPCLMDTTELIWVQATSTHRQYNRSAERDLQ
jgi:hypothetical protein